MTTLYKLTDAKGYTWGRTHWEVGKINSLPKRKRPKLCSGDVLHAYRSIDLAFLMNPIHGCFESPRLYEVEGEVVVDDGTKVGCFSQTVVKRLDIPSWVGSEHEWEVRLRFAIACAKAVAHLNTDPRAEKAIQASEDYLDNPCKQTARAASYAARAASYAAHAAAHAAYAAHAAAYAVDAAAHAVDASYAARAAQGIDLVKIAAEISKDGVMDE